MPIVRFEVDHLVRTAWKNGGGSTHEIVRVPAGSSLDAFDWRVSVADVAADGPFSTFAGFDRVLVLLSGDGVHLRSTDGRIDHRLDEPLTPLTFAGETPIEASLIGGETRDFNVMTRRAAVRADVEVVVASRALGVCAGGVLFAARGAWDARSVERDTKSFSLDSNQGLWWEGEPFAWQLIPREPAAALIAVRVR
jgi:environmental stress-induced protein Ves